MVVRIGLVGIGKIARDQHIPALAADPQFELVATASRSGEGVDAVPAFETLDEMIAIGPSLDAVSLCTPPGGRDALAAEAIAAGMHVMLEKPPGTRVAEVEVLATLARRRGVTLFASWHSREAAGVAPARAWLERRRIESVQIVWREDIRRWHPGQEWILGPDGFGVFDPGINALSIVTSLLPKPLTLASASISVPKGRYSPIAAALAMRSGATDVSAEFDFLQTGPQSWDIVVHTDSGVLSLEQGGRILKVDDQGWETGPDEEYPRLYGRFSDLIAAGAQDVDVTPLALVTEALEIAERQVVAAFAF